MPKPSSVDATQPAAAPSESRLQLTLVERHQSYPHDLPERGRALLGRADCDVVLSDGLVSRRHAALHVGDVVTLEDLGSRHGTWLRGARLTPGRPVPLEVGDAFRLGERVHGILQTRMRGYEARKVRRHGYFEERLDDECGHDRRAFVLLRVSVQRIESWVESELLSLTRPLDVVGQYGPGEYELLLPDLAPEAAEATARSLAARFTERFRALRNPVRVGVAVYPWHGRSAGQLMARACQDLAPAAPAESPPVVVAAESMRVLHEHLERFARAELRVLLLGETGVGKEVFARALRAHSPRRDKVFEVVNCATLKESLAASELFGHRKGAFTGADRDHRGILDRADGGTVFLDEIGELPREAQADLLRFIEEGEVRPVGSSRTHKVDVWVLGATNRPLDAGALRHDLCARFPIKMTVPALRERREEIEPLARRFILDAARGTWRDPPRLSTEALAALAAHAWPGNVRELKNEIVRALALCDGDVILPEHLSFTGATAAPPRPADASARERELVELSLRSIPPAPPGLSREESHERHRMLAALIECRWNQSQAAERLHIVRERFCEKMRRYAIPGTARPPRRGPT